MKITGDYNTPDRKITTHPATDIRIEMEGTTRNGPRVLELTWEEAQSLARLIDDLMFDEHITRSGVDLSQEPF